MAFSLNQHSYKDSSKMILRTPDDEIIKLPDGKDDAGKDKFKHITFDLLRKDCKEAQAFSDKQQNKRLKNIKIGEGIGSTLAAQDVRNDVTDFMVHCTIGWSNLMEDDGKELEFSKENARALYARDDLPWLRNQVYDFIDKSGNFQKN